MAVVCIVRLITLLVNDLSILHSQVDSTYPEFMRMDCKTAQDLKITDSMLLQPTSGNTSCKRPPARGLACMVHMASAVGSHGVNNMYMCDNTIFHNGSISKRDQRKLPEN